MIAKRNNAKVTSKIAINRLAPTGTMSPNPVEVAAIKLK